MGCVHVYIYAELPTHPREKHCIFWAPRSRHLGNIPNASIDTHNICAICLVVDPISRNPVYMPSESITDVQIFDVSIAGVLSREIVYILDEFASHHVSINSERSLYY